MAVIVEYKEQYFLWFGSTKSNMCRLIDSTGKKYSGTPAENNLQVVDKILPHVEYNNHSYVKTKIGVFSCASGNLITHPDIVNLF